MAPIDKNLAWALRAAPKRVVALAVLTEELIRVLTREVDLVKQRRLDEHRVLLKEKQRLATGYRTNMQDIVDHPEILKSLPEEAKAALRDLARKLAEASDTNAQVLRGAIQATKQLIANVMSMIKSTVMTKQTYRNTSKPYIQPGAYSPTCQPIAVSRSV